jgi:hypothetical protein
MCHAHDSNHGISRYKLDLAAVQEVRWDKGDNVRAGDHGVSMGK